MGEGQLVVSGGGQGRSIFSFFSFSFWGDRSLPLSLPPHHRALSPASSPSISFIRMYLKMVYQRKSFPFFLPPSLPP